MQRAKMHDDAETLRLKLHPIPSVACDHASDAFPTLGDDQNKSAHYLITETKSTYSIKLQKCATLDDSSLGDDVLSDYISTAASITNSYDYEDNFYDDYTLNSDENTVTSWYNNNSDNSTNVTRTDLLLNVIK